MPFAGKWEKCICHSHFVDEQWQELPGIRCKYSNDGITVLIQAWRSRLNLDV